MIEHNSLVLKNFAKDHQIDNIHMTVNKTDITGPIVRTISTE